MNKPYRPCNGDEGEWFDGLFCDRCEHDRIYRESDEGGCEILGRALAFGIDHAEYPKEWVAEEDGRNPRCLAFEEVLA